MGNMTEFWIGKTVWLSGATGAWGKEICTQLLKLPVRRVVAFARGEHRVSDLAAFLGADDRIRARLGDVRDPARVLQTMEGADIVIHAAALKRVDAVSHDALEIVKTNILGTLNVVEACIANRPQTALFISSDKAVEAHNIYGGTKFVGEHLWQMGNEYAPTPRQCKFAVLRSGNALGSTGSVLHIWKRQYARGEPLTITDPRMTRFHVTLPDIVALLIDKIPTAEAGQTIIPKLPVYTIGQLAEAYAPGYPVQYIGSRAMGEKREEKLSIDSGDSSFYRPLSVEALREILRKEGWG